LLTNAQLTTVTELRLADKAPPMPFNAPKLAQCWNVTFVIATEAPVMTKAGPALPLQSNTVSPKTPAMR
jgi:hypothetical protein